jgi:2-dehydropantoate 2-reductase
MVQETTMKICIYGAGAIGGYMGAQLARAGADVSFVARGPHLAAMQANGVRLQIDGEVHEQSCGTRAAGLRGDCA